MQSRLISEGTEHSDRRHGNGGAAREILLIGAASGIGGKDARCAEAPDFLRRLGLADDLAAAGVHARWRDVIRADPPPASIPVSETVSGVCRRIAEAVQPLAGAGDFFAVLGGDHSCAIGTWKGVADAVRKKGPPGLIWLDAHMDSHTPLTSPSGRLHGMPLACLLGQGPENFRRMAGCKQALPPEHVCLIGAHSFEPEEKMLLDGLGVRVFYIDEVMRRGLDAVTADALDIAAGAPAGFGISIDLDGIDPEDAPAVGSPVAGGVRACDLIRALPLVGRLEALLGIEIAEFNPYLDEDGKTARLIREMLATIARRETP